MLRDSEFARTGKTHKMSIGSDVSVGGTEEARETPEAGKTVHVGDTLGSMTSKEADDALKDHPGNVP